MPSNISNRNEIIFEFQTNNDFDKLLMHLLASLKISIYITSHYKSKET